MKKGQIFYQVAAVAAGTLSLLFVLFAFPATVYAADTLDDIDITVALQQDGSADITEVVQLEIGPETGYTEYYIALPNLDNEVISNFTVTDENGRVFTDVGNWNSDKSREDKAGKSGLIKTNSGYELCWGFGEYGAHTYTLTYHITNVVKGYDDADMMTQVFVPEGSNNPQNVHITVEYPGNELSQQNTGVWVFGFSADYGFKGGKIEVQSDQAMTRSQFAGVMAEFDKGMFSPTDVRDRSAEDVKSQAFEGSDYKAGAEDFFKSVGSIFRGLFNPVVIIVVVSAIMAIFSRKRSSMTGTLSLGGMKPEYKDPPYSRELPFQNSLSSTYARLDSLRQIPNEGAIIGAFLLKWMRAGQVDVLVQTVKNKEESVIGLRQPDPDMLPTERALYDMLISAAGADGILQAKEFEKWSKTRFTQVQGWLERYKNQGMQNLRQMGAVQTTEAKSLGIFPYQKNEMTPLGEDMTVKMFGFKKYLQDFTIINEREAKEVQLWDEYLVFAQVFGIAEAVAQQFGALYPDYFRGLDPATGQVRPIDMYVMLRLSNSYGYAMSRGYQAGVTAHNTRYSGGGGHSSFGGGGGFSGGGGGGGMGGR